MKPLRSKTHKSILKVDRFTSISTSSSSSESWPMRVRRTSKTGKDTKQSKLFKASFTTMSRFLIFFEPCLPPCIINLKDSQSLKNSTRRLTSANMHLCQCPQRQCQCQRHLRSRTRFSLLLPKIQCPMTSTARQCKFTTQSKRSTQATRM